MTEAIPHRVYRCYDRDGALLYIGMTKNVVRRLHQHKQSSAWHQLLHRVESEEVADEATARKRERELIETLAPIHNKPLDKRAPGAGRPLSHEAHKVRATVTLSPRAWAIVAAYRARHRHRSVSAALEALLRQEETT
jgi:excinuclease UvrABC nuclease subunit